MGASFGMTLSFVFVLIYKHKNKLVKKEKADKKYKNIQNDSFLFLKKKTDKFKAIFIFIYGLLDLLRLF